MNATEQRREIVGGVTTFFTMVSVVVLNPAILATEQTGMAFSGVMTATVMVCFLGTLMMGLYAKLPFAIAPGMGMSAFFTFTLILDKRVPWQAALGLVFWSGLVFQLLSLTGLRAVLARAIPPSMRVGAAAGIGIWMALLGLKGAGVVAAHPVTYVALGVIDETTLFFVLGLVLVAVLASRKSPIAFLAGIGGVTLLGMLSGRVKFPEKIVALPDFGSVTLRLDVLGALQVALIPALMTLLFASLFDSVFTFVGVAEASGLKDAEGQPRNLREGLIANAFSSLISGLFGTSPGTTSVESAAGIEVGARTGRAAVICALCFLPCFFLAPLARMVPPYATAPVLIVVGALMFRSALRVDLGKVEDLIPVFLTALLIPLTSSITQGILWGFIAHVALYVAVGRVRDVHPVTFFVGTLSIGLLVLESHR